MGTFLLITIAFIVYFLPTINAKSANHRNSDAILLVNIFFGWTLLGWLIALIWSATK